MNNYSTSAQELIHALGKIEAQIKQIEKSPNRMFVLTEYDTLSSFHCFNLCLKEFWEKFDCNSAIQLLLFKKIMTTYSELRSRYESLFNVQMNYLDNVLDLDGKRMRDWTSFKFREYGTDVIGFYNEFLKDYKYDEDEPFFKLEPERSPRTLYLDDAGKTTQPHLFHSNTLDYLHYACLCDLKECLVCFYKLMSIVSHYPNQLVSDYEFSTDDIIYALEKGLYYYAKKEGWKVERDLKKTAQELKPNRNESLVSVVWGLVMKKEDELYDLVISGGSDTKEEKFLENFIAKKEQLTLNSSLLQIIKKTCLDEELFDIQESVITHQLLSSLDADNLNLFYELVLRRNIIQREMYPDKLRPKYDTWLKGDNGQLETMVTAKVVTEDNAECGIPTGAEAEENDIITKYDHFVEAVKPYKFLECPAVACLNEKQRGQLVRQIVNRHDNSGAYAIAMLCELEYDKWMMENFAKAYPNLNKLTKKAIQEHWSDALSLNNVRAVAGNYNVIRNPNSKEDKTKYKASEYTIVVHKDYMDIKNDTQASE